MNTSAPGIQHPYRRQVKDIGGGVNTPHPFRWVVPSYNYILSEINPSLKGDEQHKLCLVENTGLIYRLVQAFPPQWDFVFKLDVNTVPALVKALDDIQGLMESKASLIEFNLMVNAIHQINDALANFITNDRIANHLGANEPNLVLGASQGRILKGMIDDINVALGIGGSTLTNLQEIVQFMNLNRDLIESLTIDSILGLRSELNLRLRASDLTPLYLSISQLADEMVSKSNIADNLDTSIEGYVLSANQGKVLSDRINAVESLLLSDDQDLDTLQELVEYIKVNRDTLDSLTIDSIYGLRETLDQLSATLTESSVVLTRVDGLETSIDQLAITVNSVSINVNGVLSEINGVLSEINNILSYQQELRTDIDYLTNKSNDQELKLSSHDDELDSIKLNITTNKSEHEQAIATLTDNQANVILNRIVPLENEVVSARTIVENVINQIATLDSIPGLISSLSDIVEDHSTSIDSHTLNLDNHSSRIQTVENELTSLVNSVLENETNVNGSISSVNNSLGAISLSLSALETNYGQYTQDTNSLINGIQTNLSNLSAFETDTNSSISTIFNTLSYIDSQLVTVVDRLEGCEDTLVLLEEDYIPFRDNTNSRLGTLEDGVSSINQQIINLQQDINSTSSEIQLFTAQTNTTLSELKSKNVTQDQSLEDIASSISSLVSKTDDTNVNLTALSDTVSDIDENITVNLADINTRLNGIDNQIGDQSAALTTHTDNIESIGSDVESIEQAVDSHSLLIGALQQADVDITQAISDLDLIYLRKDTPLVSNVITSSDGTIDLRVGNSFRLTGLPMGVSHPINITKPDLTNKVMSVTIMIDGQLDLDWPSDIIWVETPILGPNYTMVVLAVYADRTIGQVIVTA